MSQNHNLLFVKYQRRCLWSDRINQICEHQKSSKLNFPGFRRVPYVPLLGFLWSWHKKTRGRVEGVVPDFVRIVYLDGPSEPGYSYCGPGFNQSTWMFGIFTVTFNNKYQILVLIRSVFFSSVSNQFQPSFSLNQLQRLNWFGSI